MKISIFGLGYVGAVSAACLSRDGNQVIGVDPNQTKIDLINDGMSPVIEQDVDKLIREAVDAGRLSATSDFEHAVANSDLSLVCVGTPSESNGSLDLRYVSAVCNQIGSVLASKSDYHLVVIRSTVLPGTLRSFVIPELEKTSGKTAGKDFGVCSNPEFLREGTAVYDYDHPPKTVIGQIDAKAGDILAELYQALEAPLIRTHLESAEMVKYSDNAWHAVKVCFANEMGAMCKSMDIDSWEVMDIFCQDTKLNLSPYYLKPGFAFGGSCLPKDVRALVYKSRNLDVDLPLLTSILPSNQRQVERGLSLILGKQNKKIGFLGFSFKAGTDDLRESPLVELIERLIGKGFDIKIYDKNINLAKLFGANRDYILNHIPHISNLMSDNIEEVLSHSETLVIGNRGEEFANAITGMDSSVEIVDLVRCIEPDQMMGNYDGICW